MRITNLKYKVVKGFALCLESKENVSSNHAVTTWQLAHLLEASM